MKAIKITGLLIAMISLISVNSFAQFSTSGSGRNKKISTEGEIKVINNKVLVGNTLQILPYRGSLTDASRGSIGSVDFDWLNGKYRGAHPSEISMIDFNNGGDIDFVIHKKWVNNGENPFLSYKEMKKYTKMRIDIHGRVGIGTTTFPSYDTKLAVKGRVVIGDLNWYDGRVDVSGYKLYVEEGIRTEHIKCDLKTEWADYVFNDSYELKPLEEVENYIEENNHLPGIPSAEELKKDGIDITGMLKMQMEKIEELTLYMIKQEKIINELVKNKTVLK